MKDIGDRILLGNPEDIMSFRVFEINDIYEVSQFETYFEIMEYKLLNKIGD